MALQTRARLEDMCLELNTILSRQLAQQIRACFKAALPPNVHGYGNTPPEMDFIQFYYEEQNHAAANILSQSDLKYIIDKVGEISNDGIGNCFLDTPVCENETPRQVPENDNEKSLVTTPMPSPCRTFRDPENEFNYLSESSAILSDATLRSSPLGSSEMSGSSTPHHRKKKRQYVRKAITKNRIINKSNWLDEKRKVLVNLGEAHASQSGKQQMAKQIKGPCSSNYD